MWDEEGRRELIFVGIVESLGPPPDHWRGAFPSFQEVRYRVEEPIKGDAGPSVRVTHAVVRGSPTAEPGDVPGLSSVLFAPGARLVVVGIEQAGGWCSPSEYFGAMPYSRFLVEQFRRATAR